MALLWILDAKDFIWELDEKFLFRLSASLSSPFPPCPPFFKSLLHGIFQARQVIPLDLNYGLQQSYMKTGGAVHLSTNGDGRILQPRNVLPCRLQRCHHRLVFPAPTNKHIQKQIFFLAFFPLYKKQTRAHLEKAIYLCSKLLHLRFTHSACEALKV